MHFIIAGHSLLSLFLILFFNMYDSNATVSEQFAVSASSLALAGQSSIFNEDLSVNYYAPALLSTQKKSAISIQTLRIDANFKEMNDIVTSSPINNNTNEESRGNYNPNIDPVQIFAFHTNLKLSETYPLNLGFSFITPMSEIITSNSGDPLLPNYVRFSSTLSRPELFINLGYSFNENWSMAVGGFYGLQVSGQTQLITRLNNENYASLGRIEYQAQASRGLVASLAYQKSWSEAFKGVTTFNYQQQMRSNSQFNADVTTQLGGTAAINNGLILNNMLYYQPHIYRITQAFHWYRFNIYTTIEYQNWSGYQTPKLIMKGDTGSIINDSVDYEQLKSKNILLPKLGLEYQLSTNHILQFGWSYQPSIIENDLTLAGNSLDPEMHKLSTGLLLNTSLLGNPIQIQFAYLHSFVSNQTVTKINGRENNEPGNLIGSPGYQVGGHISVFSCGLNWYMN